MKRICGTKRVFVLMAVTAAVLLGLSVPAALATGGTIHWTGQGSSSVHVCTRGTSPYLHWILTEGGNGSVSSVTLKLGGSGVGTYAMSQHGYSWTAVTGYYELGTLTASATYTGSLGSGTANLVISDGCYNQTTVPATTLIGSIAAAGLLGIGLVFLQLRRRRRRTEAA